MAHSTCRLGLVVLAVGLAAPCVFADLVDLEWRPGSQTVSVGDTVSVELYAVSDSTADHAMSALDVILNWDPGYLDLIGVVNNGGYSWLFSAFGNDSGLDDLNGSFADGDALYGAGAQLGDPAYATPSGLLVATFQFEALAVTTSTDLTMPLTAGSYTETRVVDGTTPGLNVLGSAGSATVTIVPEPSTAILSLLGFAFSGLATHRRR